MELAEFTKLEGVLGCGVYALCFKGKVVYIGRSDNMLRRIYTHRTQWAATRKGKAYKHTKVKGYAFDEVHCRPCHPDKVVELEAHLIELYKPKHNTLIKSPIVVPLPPMELRIGKAIIGINKPVGPIITRRLGPCRP